MSLLERPDGADGLFAAGRDGVRRIRATKDGKVDLIEFGDKTLCYVKSAAGYPALYPWREPRFEPKAEAILMDLDGTSVRSEGFWMWVIEQTVARLLGKSDFCREKEDEPFISGHSVTEHLLYMIGKYAPGSALAQARQYYDEIVAHEMNELMHGRGKENAFAPAPHLKEFLTAVKENGIRVGLVTSGLYEKAMPEILSAFRRLNMGDPLEFYDCVITAGTALRRGQAGTLGELEPKPHPWLYAETARVGLAIPKERAHKVLGIEDSAAGVLSIRLAGFACAGVRGGNIAEAGVDELCACQVDDLTELLDVIL